MSHNKKKVIIIGAGISGMSAASYLQMNGYDTEIFEMHNVPGGLCTGWKRKEYYFDGCIHWLMGTNSESEGYEMWNEIADMDKMKFVHHNLVGSFELDSTDNEGNHFFHFYGDADKLRDYMVSISPEDKEHIETFTNAIKKFATYKMPSNKKAPELENIIDMIKMIRYMPILGFINKWKKITNVQFANKFKHPFLKEAFIKVFNDIEFGMVALIFQFGLYHIKNGGYPIGGSLNFAKNIESKYNKLGGKINYNSKIDKVIVENDIAKGIALTNGEKHYADYVISASDWRYTVFHALEGKYTNQEIEDLHNLKKMKVFESFILLSLGVNDTYENQKHNQIIQFDEPYTLPDGQTVNKIIILFFNFDDTVAPKGKTVVNALIQTNKGEYWEELRKNDIEEYKKQKQSVAQKLIDTLESKYKGIKDKIEVQDIATPATVIRYTNNWKGSQQGWFPEADFIVQKPLKKTLPGLKNFYMIGQWIQPGGGLPPALIMGRHVAQIICKKDKKKFTVL